MATTKISEIIGNGSLPHYTHSTIMSALPHPALSALLAELGESFVLAQVLLQRRPDGIALRHVADRDALPTSLESLAIPQLRALAQATRAGTFRPLKAAPSLRTGWRAHARTDEELACALDHLYPGGLADWFAARRQAPPLTHYREYTARQTGMYRVTTHLSDAQAAAMIQACCDPGSCLKRRLWTVEGLAPDAAAKSTLPCLEPCAVLLEFARKVARIEQEPRLQLQVSSSELASLQASLRLTLKGSSDDAAQREADFADPLNARRLRLLLAATLARSSPDVEPDKP
jgi:hypothetical protein